MEIFDTLETSKPLNPLLAANPALTRSDFSDPYYASQLDAWKKLFAEDKSLEPLIENAKELGRLMQVQGAYTNPTKEVSPELERKIAKSLETLDFEKLEDPKNRFTLNQKLQQFKDIPYIGALLTNIINGPNADARNGIANKDFVNMSNSEAFRMFLLNKDNAFRFAPIGNNRTLVFRNSSQKPSATPTPTTSQNLTDSQNIQNTKDKDKDNTRVIPAGEEEAKNPPPSAQTAKGKPGASSGYKGVNAGIPGTRASSKTSEITTKPQQMVNITETEGKGPEGRKDNPYIEKEIKNNEYDWLGGLIALLAMGGMGYLYGKY